MKTDIQLQRDVEDELAWEPSVDHASIGVGVRGGVVTLSGLVRSYAEKLAAEKASRRVSGVRAIADELKVRYPSDPKTDDAEIAKRIADIFAWDALIPADDIQICVEHGWVTLQGKVPFHYQMEAARKAAGRISGVLGISNLIKVERDASAADVHERIQAAFKRQADLDSSQVTVQASGGKVTLGGKVKAWHERQVAERAAWAAPGVTMVEDQIVLA